MYMKLMNFRRLDPAYRQQGKVGLGAGNALEEDVWKEFSGDSKRCALVADAIRAALVAPKDNDEEAAESDFEDVDVEEADEGKVLTRLHRRKERSRKLVAAKKRQVLKKNKELRCEACGFVYLDKYGERGRNFIECHHTKPVETLPQGVKTRLDDLVLVCANCHRMIHAGRPWLSMPELVALLHTTGKKIS